MYDLKLNDLSESQALENVKAIVKSEHFRQYDMRSGSRLSSNFLRIESIGGYDEQSHGWFKLGDVAECLDVLLDKILNDPKAKLREVYLNLYTPKEIKEAVGFDKETAEELEMCLDIDSERLRDSGHYQFNAVNLGLDEGYYKDNNEYRRDKRRYDKWCKIIDGELQKLPHMMGAFCSFFPH